MKLVEYNSDYYDLLHAATIAENVAKPLRHKQFLEHYFLSHSSCRLHLLLDSNEKIIGTLGLNKVTLEQGSKQIEVGIGSNFFSFVPGAGSILLLHWMKNSSLGMTVVGSPEWRDLMKKNSSWKIYKGIKRFYLNWQYPYQSQDPLWRRALKKIARTTQRTSSVKFTSRIKKTNYGDIEVVEEKSFSPELIPASTDASLRILLDSEYLSWRYNLSLPYTQYRLFRILRHDTTCGYIVFNETPERLTLAVCDGKNSNELAYAILIAIATLNQNKYVYREVSLTSSCLEMQKIFTDYGFVSEKKDIPIYFGSFNKKLDLPDVDTSEWLINYDISDNCLIAGI